MTKIVNSKYTVMSLLHKIKDFNTPLNQQATFVTVTEISLSLSKMLCFYVTGQTGPFSMTHTHKLPADQDVIEPRL